MSLNQTVLGSLKWSTLAELSSKAVGPLVFLALARILTPVDFGVVGAAMLIISLSNSFWEAGLSKALIRHPEDPETTATTVFWLNLGFSVLVTGAIIACANPIATLFKDSRITYVICALALQLPLAAFGSVQSALLQRSFSFKKLFFVRLVTTVAPGILSIPLAVGGLGYWALVAGTLFGSAAQSAALWYMSPWRPRWMLDRKLARKLLGFGVWVMGEGLLGWFYMWGDGFLVGVFLGTYGLGVYRTGSVLVALVFSIVLSPTLPVIYSAFSRYQHDGRHLGLVLLRTQKALFALALPLGLGFFILSNPVADLVFGEKWHGISMVIGILGLINGLSWLMGANAEAYKAMNRPDLFTKIMMVGLIYYVPAYYLSLRHGVEAFLWTRLALFLVSQGLHFYVLKRCLGIGPIQVFSNSAQVVLAAILYCFGYWVFDLTMAEYLLKLPNLVENAIRLVVFGALVITVYYVTLKSDFEDIFGKLFLKFGRQKAASAD